MATQSEVCSGKGNKSEQMTAMQSVECRDPRGHSANAQRGPHALGWSWDGDVLPTGKAPDCHPKS